MGRGLLIDKWVSQTSSAPFLSKLGRLWLFDGEGRSRRRRRGSVIGRSPVRGIRLVLEWEVTTAREPVIVLPKCSIFRYAGMQIKCQLGEEDMKHWQYEVLKSLNWERLCVRWVIVVAYSVLLRKYIPYPIYQACLGRHSRITWSVSHKLRTCRALPALRDLNEIDERDKVWQEITYSYQGHWYFVSFCVFEKKVAFLIFTGMFFFLFF